MDSGRWREIERLFVEALELDPSQRAAWLQQNCGDDAELRREVESLLASDQEHEQGFLESKVAGAAAAVVAPPRTMQRVGPYEIVRELGRGGMGTVYLARRADDHFQNQVAIKLVRPGLDTDFLFMRFKRERQILATFQHPNIARLLDGGTTDDDLPYIVMEYVNGPRITEYCRERALGLEARLDLFRDVCAAVEYAHRRFVVHRDIKPGNILVDEGGTPKLLDFGICKLLYSGFEQEPDATLTGAVAPMTPDYASPEQVRGEAVTIASDIYSLGAVLYELLTGTRPHRITQYSAAGVERAICEQETVLPSRSTADPILRKRLSGDLDNILMRALHKDPARRYGTAAELADDIRRYLSNRPVHARADSRLYRLGKFVRRHRIAVAGAAVAMAGLAVAAGMAVREARLERVRAEETRRLANTLLFEVHDALRDVQGATNARHVLVRNALNYLGGLARNTRNDANLMFDLARAYQRLGDVQGGVMGSNLGDSSGALESYRHSLKLHLAAAAVQTPTPELALERIELRRKLGDLLSYTRSTNEALEQFGAARTEAAEMLPKTPFEHQARLKLLLVDTALGEARVRRLAENASGSLESAQTALRVVEQFVGGAPNDPEIVTRRSNALSAVGMAEQRLGQPGKALEYFNRSVALLASAATENPSSVGLRRQLMLAWSHVGDATSTRYDNSNHDDGSSLRAYANMAVIARELYEHDTADQRARSDYGIALMRVAGATPASRFPNKLQAYQDAHRLLAEASSADASNQPNRVNLAFVEYQLGELLSRHGRGKESLDWWRKSSANAEHLSASGQFTPARIFVDSSRRLGEAAAARGQREEALSWAAKAVKQGEGTAARDGASLSMLALRPRAYAAAASIIGKTGRSAEALDYWRKADAAWAGLASRPGFSKSHRADWDEVRAALKGIKP